MIAQFRLGAQLARAGGKTRAILVIFGNAIGVVVALGTVAAPKSIPGGFKGVDADHRILILAVTLTVLAPVLILLMAVGRLSSRIRDRRLAALRLIGVSPAGTRVASATENGIVAAIGAILGVGMFAALAPIVDHLVARGPKWFIQPLSAGVAPSTVVCIAVVAASVVVSLAPTRAVTVDPLGVRRTGDVRRPNLLRLVPLAATIAFLGWVVSLAPSNDSRPESFARTVIVGIVLCALALPLAVPVFVRIAGDLMVRWGRGTAVLFAGRRIQLESAGVARVVTGVTVAVFVVTGACSVLASFTAVPQYVNANRALTTGPQWAQSFRTSDGAAAKLAQTSGVQAWAPEHYALTACDYVQGDPTPLKPCRQALVATCEQMEVVMNVESADCVDGRPLVIVTRVGDSRAILGKNLTFYGADTNVQKPTPDDPHVSVKPTAITNVLAPPDQYGSTYDVLIPPNTPGVESLIGKTNQWIYRLDGGAAVRERMQNAADGLGIDFKNEDVQPVEAVRAYRVILWTVAGIVLAVGLSALLIGSIDRVLERRAWIAAQLAIGVPLRTLRRAQVIQGVVPLAVGLAGALSIGALAGAAYLNMYGDTPGFTPWGELGTLAKLCLAAALITALATLPALGRRLDPRFLRRE